ncbi:Zn-dependent hydrolase (plasmid) [Natrinema zhouii]|uniref:Zn-dependent hydrolase n=1 Tax=Natrinema zhouii TaxID=1710539 RepID=UPI001CFFEABA|nr:Zn-dependent hydrolase [Natrinema zhouii]UHQ98844.1 Zn-dependent hydrolase [Natrinema zhouii]
MEVNQERLRHDLERNAEFGAIDVKDGHGRTVLTGSEADKHVRSYLHERMEMADMDVRVDAVGNICGRWVAESANPNAAPVAAGSHLDSVPEGGIFDGPLGVYGALEAVRAIQKSRIKPDRPIEVVAFTEEEGGRFDVGLLGSSVACGLRDETEVLALEDDNGVSLAEYLDRIGYRGSETINPEDWEAFFELHIEQGRRLEKADVAAGVVTAINGLTNCEVEIVGDADHASTAMDERTDAMAAASEFVLDVEEAATELARTTHETAVGTVGSLINEPNARNVVPKCVRIRTDFRAVEHHVMDKLVAQARRSLTRLESERGIETSLDRYRDQAPTPMSDHCRDALHGGAEAARIETINLHSGGGHDTINVAELTDAALLFAPSENGISHNPLEWTDWEDCATATQVLAEGLATIAK